MPWMARILDRSSSNPSAARAACSSQPAARSGMPRCTDRYPSSRYAAAATRDAGRPGFRASDCSDSGSNPSDFKARCRRSATSAPRPPA